MPRAMVTIAFTSHRVETIPFAKKLMERHDAIILEEAPTANFGLMLAKKMSITDYVREEGLEFPEFSRRYYRMLRTLSSRGKEIIQIEPYLERLIRIHELFSAGKEPRHVMADPSLRHVYQTEKNAARALFRYYQTSLKGSFPVLIESVREFAKQDAARFRMRDTMRARAIARAVQPGKTYYVESGGIHVFLVNALRKTARGRFAVLTENVMEPQIRHESGESAFLAPGDKLTVHYIFQKGADREFERLMAARSIVYIMLLEKRELLPSRTLRAPHIRDEIMANNLVSRLDIEACAALFEKIRHKNRTRVLEIVKETFSNLEGDGASARKDSSGYGER